MVLITALMLTVALPAAGLHFGAGTGTAAQLVSVSDQTSLVVPFTGEARLGVWFGPWRMYMGGGGSLGAETMHFHRFSRLTSISSWSVLAGGGFDTGELFSLDLRGGLTGYKVGKGGRTEVMSAFVSAVPEIMISVKGEKDARWCIGFPVTVSFGETVTGVSVGISGGISWGGKNVLEDVR